MSPESAPRLRRLAAAAWLAGLLAAGMARAEGFHAPAKSSRLEPGASARVRWDPSREESQADEMELVLSLDGGATFPIRVTGALSVETSEWTWRVPTLPTLHARLALRMGEKENSRTEQIAFVSEEFEIVAREGAPLERVFPIGGEWRTKDALDGRRAAAAIPASLDPEPVPASLESAAEGTPISPPRSPSIEGLPRATMAPRASESDSRSAPRAVRPRPNAPLLSLRL